MTHQIVRVVVTAALLVGATGCDGIWHPQCTEAQEAGCLATTLKATVTPLSCGTQVQLDLQVFSGEEDVTLNFMDAASQMTTALTLAQSTVPLGPPVAMGSVLRVMIPRASWQQRVPASVTVALAWNGQSISTPISYPSSARKFVQAAVQKFAGSGGSGSVMKFGGLHPDPADNSAARHSLLAMTSPDAMSHLAAQYDFYSVANRALTPKKIPTNFSGMLSFSAGQSFRSTGSGYVYYTPSNNTVSTLNRLNYATATADSFGRPLLAVTGNSDLVASANNRKLELRIDLLNMATPGATNLAGDARSLAIGDLEQDATQELLVAMVGGGALVFKLLPQNAPPDTQIRTETNSPRSLALTDQLKSLELGGTRIGALAVADFDQDGLADVLVQKHLKASASPSQLGIVYGAPMGQYEAWQSFDFQEGPVSGSGPIAMQDIQTVEAGLIDDDACPDLVISTKDDVRVYLNRAP